MSSSAPRPAPTAARASIAFHEGSGSPLMRQASIVLTDGMIQPGWVTGEGHGPSSSHLLLWSVVGTLSLDSASLHWTANQGTCLWVPAGLGATLTASQECEVEAAVFEPGRSPFCWRLPMRVRRSALLAESLAYLRRRDLSPQARVRMEQVLFDLIEPEPVASVEVPRPGDPRLVEVMERLSRNPSDNRSLAEWAAELNMGTRTFARWVNQETGMGFAQWRLLLRVRCSLALLGSGMPVAAVAAKVGYSTPSAFTAVFRKITGTTPASYFPQR